MDYAEKVQTLGADCDAVAERLRKAKEELAYVKRVANANKRHIDPDKFRDLERRVRVEQTEHQRLLRERSALKAAQTQRKTVEQCFMEVCAHRMDETQFQEFLGEATAMAHDFLGASA